jgi:predicted ATPase
MKNKYTRGSEWRKWDLHVHTPNTKLNNQYKQHGDDWDQFCQKINDSDVSVFGITDYFSNENYLKFIEKFKQKYPSSKKVFFPNVEFRIDSKKSNKEHIQLHVVFSNNQETVDTINIFLTRLNLVSTDDSNSTNKYCTDTDLANVGYDKAMVRVEELQEKLKKDFTEEEYLIVGVANGYGSLRPDKTDGRGAEYAKELDKKIHLFFGTSSNTEFYLNNNTGREQYALPQKAVLSGSDAHSFEDLDKKLGKQSNEDGNNSEVTWIKADPTFEGLRQIVYEPEDRVKIQELKPEEKESYQIIDKVQFIDDSFTPNEILINQNLTTIIGGKSTGKSILLRNIAETIDDDEVSKRLNEVSLAKYPKDVSGFKVVWKDNQENEKKSSSEVNKKIIYIPQSYLNRLVDKEEDKTSIDDIIKNILEQEEDVKNVFSQLESKNRDIEKIITQTIEELFYKEDDIKNLSESIKKIGDKKGIELEVKRLKQEVVDFKKKAGMGDGEIQKYNTLLEKITNSNKTQKKLEKDIKFLEDLKSKKGVEVYAESRDILNSLEQDTQKKLTNSLTKILETAREEWHHLIDVESKELEQKKINNQNELKRLEINFKPLWEKAKQSKSLSEKIKKLKEQEKKLIEIIEQEKKYELLKENYSKLIEDISTNNSQFYTDFFNAKNEILKQRSITEGQNLEFDIKVIFEKKSFQNNFINEICDQRKLNNFEEGLLQDYNYEKNQLIEDIRKIIEGILTDKLSLKSSYSKKEAITKLVQNWFVFDYKIKQNGDDMSEMSPGKKSFVLLKLLIELDDSKCPILIDQPEDDLDNRSIYLDLVKFMKTKKKERQIIIATHNPNLVVGADSECVIVANQEGSETKNNIYQFEYVQGALEDTKSKDKSKQNILFSQGINEHVCEVLEGGESAFEQRKKKYGI